MVYAPYNASSSGNLVLVSLYVMIDSHRRILREMRPPPAERIFFVREKYRQSLVYLALCLANCYSQ